jgi:hypothetical protein
MECRRFIQALCAIVVLGAAGCTTLPPPSLPPAPPPPEPELYVPVTKAILDRAMATIENSNELQFFVSGRIILERVDTQYNDSRDELGKLEFEDVYIREQIIIEDQTPGIAVETKPFDDQIRIGVSFENSDSYKLDFTNTYGGLHEYFYLEYLANEGGAEYGEEKGLIVYGGKTYTVSYSGFIPPHLLIKRDQNYIDKTDSRTAPGRTIR